MKLENRILNSTVEDGNDAYDAWAHLRARLNTLPPNVRAYFSKLCDAVVEFDPHEDEEIALTNHLETPVVRKMARKVLGSKSKLDYGFIFDWVSSWQRTEGETLDQAFRDYVRIFELEPDEYETVKSAYHKVRRARLSNLLPTERTENI